MLSKVKDKDGNEYYIYAVNFHMAEANPFIQFCLWSCKEHCWMVDDAKNYVPFQVNTL